MCQVFFFHHTQQNCFVWWYIDYMSECCEVAFVTRSPEVSVALRVIGLARSTNIKAAPRTSSPFDWKVECVFVFFLHVLYLRSDGDTQSELTQCWDECLHSVPLCSWMSILCSPCLTQSLHFEHYNESKEVAFYQKITAMLYKFFVRSWKGETSPAGHLTGSWNKGAHKPLRQHPSDHDKYAICKTRTAEVYTVGVWTGRVTHICVSASRDSSSHAARWLVLVLSWFVYPGQLK